MIKLCSKCANNKFAIRVDLEGNLIAYACLHCGCEFKNLKINEESAKEFAAMVMKMED